MSLLAMSYAKQQVCGDPLAKFVLLLLADHHSDHTNQCFPSINKLAQEAECSTMTIHRKLQQLEQAGMIAVLTREAANGGRKSNDYRLLFLPKDIPGSDPSENPSGKRGLPPDDWRPQHETIRKLRDAYPSIEINDELIAYLVLEWINFCHAKAQRYADFERAWFNSASRYLKSRGSAKASQPNAGRERSTRSSISRAIGDLLSHD